MFDDGVATRSGAVEVRGVLIDVGRLEPGDPRVGSYAEGRDADRWPRPGEELLVRVIGVSEVAAAASTPSVRAIALEPWKFDTQKVTIVGNFRAGICSAICGSPGRAAMTSCCAGPRRRVGHQSQPRGNGFDLDVNRRVDTDDGSR